MSDVRILTTRDEVERLTQTLLAETTVAIDLEMDAMHNYREKICLAQVSTETETVIIDPLAGGDLAPLAPVFAAPGIRKIFHAADYDLRCLKRDYGFEVTNLFDTMVTAQFCGEEKIGLADLLLKYFGVELDKKYQRADWSKRPLPPEMVSYAAEDTRHLHRLVELLETKLLDLGRSAWLAEECQILEKVAFEVHEGPLFLRFKGAGKLERRQLAILEELLQWRDAQAERRNVPHFKVVGNKQLLAMTQSAPQKIGELSRVEGLSPRQVERYGRALLGCIERAGKVDEKSLPQFPRPPKQKRDPDADAIVSKLKQWRMAKAKELGLDPGVLVNNATLEAVARQRPQNVEQFKEIGSMRHWQIDLLAEDMLQRYRNG